MAKEEEQLQEQKESRISPFWAERNFLTLPFFVLDGKSDANVIEYHSTIRESNKDIEFDWKVYGTALGLPKVLDWQVHRVIEEILSELPRPITNPINFSIYEIVERMGIKHGGHIYRLVRQCIQRILFTGIESNLAFYSKAKNQHISDSFHLYERVVFRNDTLEDGTTAETNYLWLNSWYLSNINMRYIKPLDRNFYRSLRRPTSKRLYEILGVKFFGLPAPNIPLRQNYIELCQVMGIEPQRYPAWARKILNPSHEELVNTRFLSAYEWRKEGRQPHQWSILYTMGERAVAEIEQARAGTHMPPRSNSKEVIKDDSVAALQSESENLLVEELVRREVLLKKAKQLVEGFTGSKVKLVLEYTDWYRTQTHRVKRWGPYIVKLIEDPDFAVSADYLRAKVAKEEERKLEAAQIKAQEILAERLGQALMNWSDERYLEYELERMRERHKMMAQWVRKTPEEINEETKKVRKMLPKSEEERIQILQRYEYFQLKTVLEEIETDEASRPPTFILPQEQPSVTDLNADSGEEPEAQLSFLELESG